MSRAACAPENHPPVDLVEITAQSPKVLVDLARSVCDSCPLRVNCRRVVLWELDVAGMAGGMTETERAQWRAEHNHHPHQVDIVDVTPAHTLTRQMLDALPAPGRGEIHPRVRDVIIRMTRDGLTAEDIVDRLDRDDVTDRTVRHIRFTYMKGWARVEA